MYGFDRIIRSRACSITVRMELFPRKAEGARTENEDSRVNGGRSGASLLQVALHVGTLRLVLPAQRSVPHAVGNKCIARQKRNDQRSKPSPENRSLHAWARARRNDRRWQPTCPLEPASDTICALVNSQYE